MMRIHRSYGAVEVGREQGGKRVVRTLGPVFVVVDRGEGTYSQQELAEGMELEVLDADLCDEAELAARGLAAASGRAGYAEVGFAARMELIGTAAGWPLAELERLVAEMRAALLAFGERRALRALERQLEVRRAAAG